MGEEGGFCKLGIAVTARFGKKEGKKKMGRGGVYLIGPIKRRVNGVTGKK